MFRVDVHTKVERITFHMQGRLAAPALAEAQRCWDAIRAEQPGRQLEVDLRAVTFIDRQGVAWLKQIGRQGASFLASGCLHCAYIAEITELVHRVEDGLYAE